MPRFRVLQRLCQLRSFATSLFIFFLVFVSTSAYGKPVSIEELKAMNASELSAWSAQCLIDLRSILFILDEQGFAREEQVDGAFFMALMALERATSVPLSIMEKAIEAEIETMKKDLSLVDKKWKLAEHCVLDVLYVSKKVYEKSTADRRASTNTEEDIFAGDYGGETYEDTQDSTNTAISNLLGELIPPEVNDQLANDRIFKDFKRVCLAGLVVLDGIDSISLGSKGVFCECVARRMKQDSIERPMLYVNLFLEDNNGGLAALMQTEMKNCVAEFD